MWGVIPRKPDIEGGTNEVDHQQIDAPRPAGLTALDLQVLLLVSRGATNHEIGRALHVSTSTVKARLSKIVARLGGGNRAGAVGEAFRRGLLLRPPVPSSILVEADASLADGAASAA
jgi:DNA-binding NarL/FixJ family response regulator